MRTDPRRSPELPTRRGLTGAPRTAGPRLGGGPTRAPHVAELKGRQMRQIINRFTARTLYTCETADSSREAVIQAVAAGADLTGAYLVRAYLVGANLTGAFLVRANLTGVDLARANLTGAFLARANLTDADLTGADLTGARLVGANLAGADLTEADLTEAD